MPSILASLQDLFTSIFEVIFSVCQGTFDTIAGLTTGAVSFVVETIKLALHTVGETLKAAGGLGNLIASNIVLIAVVAGGIYGYVRYQSRQGRPVQVGNKKLN